MGLACECDIDCDWYYHAPKDFTELATSKRQRCCSCRNLIDVGAISVTFASWRNPRDEIEERIYGECGEVPMANKYMCESCGDIYFNLTALDFCVNLGDSMKHLMSEYREHYAPPKLSDNIRSTL